MSHFSKFIKTRLTLLGFVVVIFLCAMVIIALLIQVDVWSKAAFNLVKNNSQQVRLVMTMRDVVQKRELAIQRMLNMRDEFERDAEAVNFKNLAAIYANAREELLSTSENEVLLKKLKDVDEAVANAYPYHENLVDALVLGGISQDDISEIVRQGRLASRKVLSLLDKIVENQSSTYDIAVTNYETSRQYTLFIIAIVFAVITFFVMYILRLSGRQLKQISRLTIIDDVSGTYNRRYFDMVLEEEWKRSMREYTPLSLLMVDIDYFKAYNDSFGHQMGDVCLYAVGKILSGQLNRASDFTARYGGEEFAIVLPNTKVEYARLLAERIRRSVEEARIKAGNEKVSPWVTVSIGVATTTAEYEQSSSVLIKAADSCLYDSKHKGRNRVSEAMLEDLC